MIRLILIAAFVVTSVATASAECAWVLWVSYSASIGSPVHQPWDSYKSLEECKRALHSEKMTALMNKNETQGVIQVPACLPDTVDPRGPKGR
jgi:hypothetical protein